MKLKKFLALMLTLILVIPVFCVPVAAEGEPAFHYELSVDGKSIVEVENGDLITVSLYLYRTDADTKYAMHAMQDEIRYDCTFFELVEDSSQLYEGVVNAHIGVTEDLKEYYMNFLSFDGGERWDAKTRIGTFQLRVIGTTGVSVLTNEDFLVSLPDGSGSYTCTANELTVILSTDCVIKFNTNGGTPIEPIIGIYGEKLTRPADPIREGKRLVGWYKDIHLTEEWDFETDVVTRNMMLYAKWEDAPVEETPTEPVDKGEEEQGESCILCHKPGVKTLGVFLCTSCRTILLILLVAILLVIAWFVCRYLKKKKKAK